MAQSDVFSLADELENIRNLSGDQLLSKFEGICSSKRPGLGFMTKLDASEHVWRQHCFLRKIDTFSAQVRQELYYAIV